ncbi:MAG TPA: kelch repeat-containing protein [Candidatus Acidoferrales bacterium]|nr:kelch repeat-containing protein [Candidatus Acidoferrales bacterium]HEV3480919.1 kelch repeat-containing protein [Candidatus Acidoferrales bacterium]
MMHRNNWSGVAIILFICFLVFPCVAQAQTFAYTGNLNTPRAGFTATLLDNGMVLIAGGADTFLNIFSPVGPSSGCPTFSTTILSSAELYNPATGTFSATGSLNTARDGQTATLLNNGMVLIVGGSGSTRGNSELSSAELYNPATGIFTVTGNLNTARSGHTATLLSNGMVLIAGGIGSGPVTLASAELYNPATGIFTVTGNLSTGRYDHTATPLNNGTVLVAGGFNSVSNPLSSAELYNTATGTFAATGSMRTARSIHTATLLNSGMVLMAGGSGTAGQLSSAELYNPTTGTFTATGNLNTARYEHTASLLNNGMVLIAGGSNSASPPLTSAELYNPTNGTFSVTGNLNAGRYSQSAVLLPNGNVLVAGGSDIYRANPMGCSSGASMNTAELYQPASLIPSGLLSITVSPTNSWAAIGNSEAFTATGTFSGNGTQTLASVTWSSSNTAVATITNDSTNHGNAFAVAAGSVTIKACAGSVCGSTTISTAPHENLILGSICADGSSGTLEEYDDTGKLLRTGNMANALSNQSATLLQNGTIFVAGGTGSPCGGTADSTLWQIFNPNGQVLSSGLLQDGRDNPNSAALLPNGNVFLAGAANLAQGTWEIHNPAGALVTSGSLNDLRGSGAFAVTLKNGNVWISGSALGTGGSCTYEIHNSTGALVGSGSLNTCFPGAQVQVLSNGNVMLLGGDSAAGTYEIRSQTGTFVTTGSLVNGFNHGASSVVLNNGNVFISGSCEVGGPPPPPPNPFVCGTTGSPSAWEIRDINGNFVSTGSLQNQYDGAGEVVLSNGNVLITGGNLCPACWEIRSPTGGFILSGSLFDTRYAGHTLTHF